MLTFMHYVIIVIQSEAKNNAVCICAKTKHEAININLIMCMHCCDKIPF